MSFRASALRIISILLLLLVVSIGEEFCTRLEVTDLQSFVAPSRSTLSTVDATHSQGENSWNLTKAQWVGARTAVEQKRAKLRESGAKRFNEPDKANDFFRQQRLGPNQTELPLDQMQLELVRIRERESSRAGEMPPGGIQSWEEVGPGNIGGRTRAIVIDPTNPDIMYAAGVAGGVFKSTNAGTNWFPTSDLMLNLAVSTIAMDPFDSSILYAGTGEGFGSGSPFVRGLGIFKTTDAGQSWTQLAGTVSGVPSGAFWYVNKIVASAITPGRIYAATRFGVWRSTDSGATWSSSLSNPWYLSTPPTSNGCSLGCTDLAIRSDSDVLYAAFGSNTADGLYRSDDGGDTWTSYSMGSHQGRMTIAIAPSDNDVVYVAMADNGGLYGYGRLAGIFKSVDGVDFAPVLDWSHEFSPWLFSYVSIATGCYENPVIYSQGWYDNIIQVDPIDPEVVWVGGINLYRSDDGAKTFGIAGYWFFYLQEPQPPIYIHPDQHAIVFHPDYDGVSNQTMYVGNDGGLFKTENARAATSQEECAIDPDPGPPPDIAWKSINAGYGVTQFYHGDAAHDLDMFVGGAQDNGSSRVLSRNDPDSWQMIYGGDGGYVAIDPTNSNRVFIEIQGFPTLQKSVNGGETFFPATNGITDTDGLFITPFTMDPSDPMVMWTGGRRPWRSTNGAGSWTLAGPDIPAANQISAIAVAPSDGNIVYLGFNNGYIARTSNGLSGSPSWSTFNNGLQLGAWVSSVAVDPVDPDVAYCTYSNFGVQHVLRTTNGGTSWSSIDGIAEAGVPDIPAHWIAIRPTNGDQLYVGTEFGVFASNDAGATWSPTNDGLAHTIVEALDFKDDDTLVAFTHGRGVFLTELLTPAGADELESSGPDAEGFGRQLGLSAIPNPFTSQTALVAELPVTGEARLAIYDASGREIAVLLQGWQKAGKVIATWDGRSLSGRRLANGTYFAHLDSGSARRTKKLILAR